MRRSQKRIIVREQVSKALQPLDNKTIGTREIIEQALDRAALYKYQKILLLVEMLQKCEDGEFS